MAMTLRLTDDDEKALETIQKASGATSKHQAVLIAIHEQAARNQRRAEINAIGDEILATYGTVLDRLAAT